MSDNIQTNTAGQTPPCLQHQIEKTRYLIKVHFSDTSAQSVEDRLTRLTHKNERGASPVELPSRPVCLIYKNF